MKSIQVLTVGGTIASTTTGEGAVPTQSGTSIVSAVPGVGERADITVTEIERVLSFRLDFDGIAAVGRQVRDLRDDEDCDGVVVTHGTDTLEETVYYLDLVLNDDFPVVVTGAQRSHDMPSADGPSNIRTAIRAVPMNGYSIMVASTSRSTRNCTRLATSRKPTRTKWTGFPHLARVPSPR